MPPETSAQQNEFFGSITNEHRLFMAGAQLNTAGGNITTIGGGGENNRLPLNVAFSDEVSCSGGGAQRLRVREGLCVLSLGESAYTTYVCVEDRRVLSVS
jgi:hypothetical protein